MTLAAAVAGKPTTRRAARLSSSGAEAPGFAGAKTPEDYRDHFDQVLSTEGITALASAVEELLYIARHVGAPLDLSGSCSSSIELGGHMPHSLATLPIPNRVEGITPDWLSQMFRQNGIEARVRSFESDSVGTGQMADNFRLTLSYETRDDSAPDSVVVKVPSENPISRASGAAGAYATEVRFYTDLASDLSVRTAGCFHGAISESNEEFILVLEDLGPAEQGDQIRGCDANQAELALRNLAGLHGSRWCAPELEKFDWLARITPEIAGFFSLIMKERTKDFIERYKALLSADDVDVLRHFAEHSNGWLLGRPERFAPVHGDYRLDNLLFGTAKGGAPVAVVDWQTVAVGLPGRDVAYFLGNSLLPADRRSFEKALVGAYHAELLRLGVKDYDLATCFEDYRYGQFQGPLVTVLGAMGVIQTERGDEMFMAMCSRSCEAIRDLDSASLLERA
jgi:hypothetical protein